MAVAPGENILCFVYGAIVGEVGTLDDVNSLFHEFVGAVDPDFGQLALVHDDELAVAESNAVYG